MLTYKKTILEEAPDLVERMKALGLVSVSNYRPIETNCAVQAAKNGMTETEYHKAIYAKRKARAQLGVKP